MRKGMYKFLSIVSSFCLCMSFFIVPVSAESDIFYPDPDNYNAYEYFFRNGYDHLILTSTNNVTYDVSLDNYGTNNGSITGTDTTTGTNNMSGSSHNTGTINSTGSTLGSKYMTCTTNNAVSGTQTYSCYFSNRSNAIANDQSITLKMNENTYSNYDNVDIGIHESTSVSETIKQTINTDITGSITSSNSSYSYIYLPWLKGTYHHPTGYESNNAIWLLAGNDVYDDFYICFYNKARVRFNGDIRTWSNNSDAVFDYSIQDRQFGNIFFTFIRFTCTSGNGNLTFDMPLSGDVVPIYYGLEYDMPDKIREMCLLQRSVGYILNKGDSETNSSISAADNANSQVSQKIGEFDLLENNSVNDMNSKISNLNLNSDILSNSKFLSSAAWVKTQFDRMTVSTPIGSVLSFSLILGMTLIFLGKIR